MCRIINFRLTGLAISAFLLMAGYSIIAPAHSQEPPLSVREAPAERFSLGDNCYFRVHLRSPLFDLGHKEVCIQPLLPRNFRAEENTVLMVNEETPIHVSEEGYYCFYPKRTREMTWDSAEGRLLPSFGYSVHTDFFLDCRATSFLVAGHGHVRVNPSPADWGSYLLEDITFPKIVAKNDVIRFAIRDKPIIPQGDWSVEGIRAREIARIKTRKPSPQTLTLLEAPFSSQAKSTLNIVLSVGKDEASASLNGIHVLSTEERIVEGSCGLPERASTGDIICAGSSSPFPFGTEGTLSLLGEGLVASLLPIAFSSHTIYFLIPEDLPSGRYILEVGKLAAPIGIVSGAGGKTYNCDCVYEKVSEAKRPAKPPLSGEDIERLKALVDASIARGEQELYAGDLQVELSMAQDHDALLSIARKVADVTLDGLKVSPILAAFSDYLSDQFESTISGYLPKKASLRSGRSLLATSRSSVRFLAVFASDQQYDRTLFKRDAKIFLAKMRQILARAKSENKDPVVSLEVRTNPTGASFAMHPRSYAENRYEIPITNGKLINIWIGVYHYYLSHPSFGGIGGDNLNLVDDRRSILSCRLSLDKEEASGCNRE
jgi:hypothetical protein